MISKLKLLFALVVLSASTTLAQTPSLTFSGVMFPQYRYTYDDGTKVANAGHATNKFDVERVYLNFMVPAGENGSVRVTTDIFNNSISSTSCVGCYAGWNVRLKYAYFQYDILHDIGGKKGFNAVVKAGMLQTVQIDHEEGFWPRYVSMTAVERNSFFASSDLGVAGLVTLPKKLGEVYATVTNGTGYSSVEADPYKDYAARLSLTPLSSSNGILKTLTISPYVYSGHTASKFLTTPGANATGAANGLIKNRDGVFVGLKDRKLVLGAGWDQRTETVETGSTLATRGSYDNRGTLTTVFTVIRPLEFNSKKKSPIGVLLRLDNFKPYSDVRSAGTQTISANNQLVIGGAFLDINSKATMALDVQHLTPQRGSTTPESKTLFAHMQISF